MKVPLLDLQAQYRTIKDEVRAAVDEIFETQRFVLGGQVSLLEEEIAQYCGVPFAVGVASGTDALLISLKALGVGPGDAVLTVPFTFFATAGAIVNLGARPIFIDIEERGFLMDPEKLESFLEGECTTAGNNGRRIHKATGSTIKALMPVHLYGQVADMDAIVRIAKKYGLPVVEDACQALGAEYQGQYAGSLGDFGCFSFFPSKNLGGAGDGGMIITSDPQLADRVRLLRTHGESSRYHHAIVGFNSRLDELQAAVLRVKLPYLNSWSESRRKNAAEYGRLFTDKNLSDSVSVPYVYAGRSHIYHQYVIRCQNRDALRTHLKDGGVDTQIYYPVSLHEQDCFRGLGYRKEDFPVSLVAAQETLALPVYPELSQEQKRYVVDTIDAFYRG